MLRFNWKFVFYKLGQLLLLLVILFSFLKIAAQFSLDNVHPMVANKLFAVQKLERDIEQWRQDVYKTYLAVVKNSEQEQKYKQLYYEIKVKEQLYNATLRENDLLKRKLNFKDRYQQRLIATKVVSRSLDGWQDYVIIDKGIAAGLKREMVVINEQGLVGYIDQVYQDGARVLLITNPKARVSCQSDRTKDIFVTYGNMLRGLSLKYATIHSDLQEGDLLSTSGYSFRFRKNIPVGSIKKIDFTDKQLFKTVQVQPSVDFAKLDIVFVLP